MPAVTLAFYLSLQHDLRLSSFHYSFYLSFTFFFFFITTLFYATCSIAVSLFIFISFTYENMAKRRNHKSKNVDCNGFELNYSNTISSTRKFRLVRDYDLLAEVCLFLIDYFQQLLS